MWLALSALVTALFVTGEPPVALGREEPAPGYRWPLTPRPAVSRLFEAPAFRFGPGHRGVDLVGGVGGPVFAAADGIVAFTGPVAGRPVLSVDHPDGLRTTYEPVVATVRAGHHVRGGEVIGVLEPGHPGCPGTACLHWGVRRGGDYLDPLRLLGTRVRLLPWEDRPTATG